MLYNTIVRVIEKGRTDGLKDKLDIYLLNNRISPDQYTELMAMLPTEEDE